MRRLLRLLLALLVAAALWLWAGRPGPVPPKPTGTLRIAAANLFYMRSEARAVSAALNALAADVLVLVEWTGKNADLAALEAPRGAQEGYRTLASLPYEGSRGAALLVGPGTQGEAEIVEPEWDSPCRAYMVIARLRVPKEQGDMTLALLGVHAPPPVNDCAPTVGPALATVAAEIEGGHLRRDWGPARAGDPVVLAGDLNTLPFQPRVRPLWQAGLRDALLVGTLRPVPTWPARTLGLSLGRIDAVWSPPELAVHGAGNFLIPGSDHHGVWADLRPADAEN